MFKWKKKSQSAENLRKWLQNLKSANKQIPPCELILGGKVSVAQVGVIWKFNASELQLISAVKLNEYVTKETFTPKELIAFKLGLSTLPAFIEACYFEHIENEKKNGQSL